MSETENKPPNPFENTKVADAENPFKKEDEEEEAGEEEEEEEETNERAYFTPNNEFKKSSVNGSLNAAYTEIDRKLSVIDEDEIDYENRCGYGSCFSPEWLQRFSSKKSFMLVFALLALVQSMCWSYYTATITTLEKRFKISSETAGIVMTGNEISQTLFSIVISYYGSRGNRARWMSIGVALSGLSCFILASPHLFYGPGLDALHLTKEFAHLSEDYTEEVTTTSSLNLNITQVAASMMPKTLGMKSHVQLCQADRVLKGDTCEKADVSIVPFVLMFLSQFVSGIGVLMFYSLGIPYLDDNMKKSKSPMMFAITMSIRLVGPTLGYLLASACMKMYISPQLTPLITTKHPQWLGAWWLGWLVLGVLMMMIAVIIPLFPKELKQSAIRRKKALETKKADDSLKAENMIRAGSQSNILTAEISQENPMPKFSELPRAILGLLKNKINLFNNLSALCYIFAVIGYYTYTPKYLETIFLQSSSSAALTSGFVSIIAQAVGLLGSGALISYFKPNARFLAAWNVVIELLYVALLVAFTQLGCNPGNMQFGSQNENGSFNLTSSCNVDCNCKVNQMSPVCYQPDNKVFYSPCHAGCNVFENGTLSNCDCLQDSTENPILGTCSQEECLKYFIIFIIIKAVIRFFDSSGRIGNMLVSYRCIDPKDKSLNIGLGIFLISIFAMLPSPIVFGRIIDSACAVWGTKCGKKGNCWFYSEEKLRYAFNLTAAGFMLLGAFFDALVWYYVKDLDLYDEDKNMENAEKLGIKRNPSSVHKPNKRTSNS